MERETHSSLNYTPFFRPDAYAAPITMRIAESFPLASPFSRMEQAENIFQRDCWNSRGLASIRHNIGVKKNTDAPQRETTGTVHMWDSSLKAKAKDDKRHCLWCLRSVEGDLEKKSPTFFDMVCADLRTHQWLPTIFSSNRRKFLKYSKMQNHT